MDSLDCNPSRKGWKSAKIGWVWFMPSAVLAELKTRGRRGPHRRLSPLSAPCYSPGHSRGIAQQSRSVGLLRNGRIPVPRLSGQSIPLSHHGPSYLVTATIASIIYREYISSRAMPMKTQTPSVRIGLGAV